MKNLKNARILHDIFQKNILLFSPILGANTPVPVSYTYGRLDQLCKVNRNTLPADLGVLGRAVSCSHTGLTLGSTTTAR